MFDGMLLSSIFGSSITHKKKSDIKHFPIIVEVYITPIIGGLLGRCNKTLVMF